MPQHYHTLPKAAFLQFSNTVYRMQMLVLHTRSHSRRKLKSVGSCVPQESNMPHHTMHTGSIPSFLSRQPHLQFSPKATDSFLELYEHYQKQNPTEVTFLVHSTFDRSVCKSLCLVWPAKAQTLTCFDSMKH